MKRFTETTKWADPWFRRLSPAAKHLWQWLLDSCDHAGICTPDLELAAFQIGAEIDMETLLELGDRVIDLGGGKLFLPKFIEFQYGTLSESCKAHNPVFVSLNKHAALLKKKGYPYPLDRDQDKDKEEREDKDKDMDKDKDQDAREIPAPQNPPPMDDLVTHQERQAEEIANRVMALRPEWSRMPLTASEMHSLVGNRQCFLALSEADWELLRAYLRTRMPEGSAYSQPRRRDKLIEWIPGVVQDAERWARKTGRRVGEKRKLPKGVK